ncbi:MAG: DoxX family protein [Muribaculaceae bacterium]|nr:DoxX family protein [Muribaculaceae bacterium]MDE6703679.1 DoxX family protein [Muribaculaceae bacterium]
MEKRKLDAVKILVWLSRLIVGLTFIVSGWAKSVDPWGFIYKIEEYFNVWDVVVPRELTLALAIAISITEFVIGIMLTFGIMRRVSAWLAAAFMVVLLPLTAYIAVADPVSDCGCFGDFIIISNVATLIKNIILTGFIIVLLLRNDAVTGIYTQSIQWLVIFGAIAYSGVLNFVGYRYQPLMDFRPYPVDSKLVFTSSEHSDEDDEGVFIYEKNGEEQSFSVDQLPDSTWTFVRAEFSNNAKDNRLTVFDGDEDVTDMIFNGMGEQLIVVVIDPGIRYLTRARLANELYRYMSARNGEMFALVAAEGDDLEAWQQLALPEYMAYSAEDTSLKELVRGDAGLIYLRDGKIIWKRNLASVSHDAIKAAAHKNIDLLNDDLDLNLERFNYVIMIVFFAWLLIIFSLNYPGKILGRYFSSDSAKNL